MWGGPFFVISATALSLKRLTAERKATNPKAAMQVVNPDGVSAFTVTLDNSSGTTTKSYRLFDQSGIVSAIDGSSKSAPDACTVSFTAVNKTTIGSPIVISGFNYQVETSNSQFANKFDILRGSVDGRNVTHPNVIQKARYLSAA